MHQCAGGAGGASETFLSLILLASIVVGPTAAVAVVAQAGLSYSTLKLCTAVAAPLCRDAAVQIAELFISSYPQLPVCSPWLEAAAKLHSSRQLRRPSSHHPTTTPRSR